MTILENIEIRMKYHENNFSSIANKSIKHLTFDQISYIDYIETN